MKKYKTYQISLLVVICVLGNCLGKYFANKVSLPLWLDTFWTIVAAYVLGPVCGGVVGMTTNLLFSLHEPIALAYGLVNFGIGFLFGILAKKKMLESFANISFVVLILSFFSVACSSFLNFLFYAGKTNNIFGDGVASYLVEKGFPFVLGSVIGEIYLDFSDKLLAVVFFSFCLYLYNKKITKWKKTGSLSCIFLICFALSMVPVAAKGAEGSSNYSSYTQTIFGKENGILSGEVNDIAQTDYGVMWIGSDSGLYRYNGTQFRWMSDFESVKNVNCLFVDEEGRIWIGTNDRGISICINETIANVFDQNSGLSSDSVGSIVQGSDGLYYIGTKKGLSVLSLVGGIRLVDTIPEITDARSLCADENGNVVAVTTAGEMFLLKEGKRIGSCDKGKEAIAFSSAGFGEDGTLFAGTTGNEIYVYAIEDEGFLQKKKLFLGEQQTVNAITISDNQEVFVCCNNGIGYFDQNSIYHEIKVDRFANSVNKMLVDYQGNIWFASSKSGLLRLGQSSFSKLFDACGQPRAVVTSSVYWKDELYVGTNEGLIILNEKSKTSQKKRLVREFQGIPIRSVFVDHKNQLWICSEKDGLYCVDEKDLIRAYGSEKYGISDQNSFVMESMDKTLYVANQSGVVLLRENEIKEIITEQQGLTNTAVFCMSERENGQIFIGTDGSGIFVLQDGKVQKTINRSAGLSSDIVLQMVADPDTGGLFVVTSNGINYINAEEEIQSFDNFPYFEIYDLMLGPKEDIFVLTSGGIYVVDRTELFNNSLHMNYLLLDAEHGFDSKLTSHARHYLSAENDAYFSTESGIYKMNLEKYTGTRRSYRIRVSGLFADGVSIYVERGTPCVVGRNTKTIDFVPEIVNYTAENPRVSYYLEGYDKGPIFLSQKDLSTVSYVNLPPGEYTFHLAIVNDSGAVLEECTYLLQKEKEIYDYGWFLFYVFLGAAVIVMCLTWFIVFHQMSKKLEVRNKELAFAKQQVEMGNETILAIARTVDAKDTNTGDHSNRVSQYAVLIAKKMGFTAEECDGIKKMALLHDIGKIGIPDRVLNKPDRLTEEEYALMKSHVIRGAEILKDFTLVDNVAFGALYHHERYDGLGYPEGLSGENIPLQARIIGIADAFDAMSFNRVYRKKLSQSYVIEELEKGKGTQFDPYITDVMISLIRENEIDVNQITRSMDRFETEV